MTATKRRGRPRAGARDPEASRRELLEAAAVEFAANGYAATTVDRIARRAGLSKGTFYWAFDSKEHLFISLLEERLDAPARHVMAVLDETPATQSVAPSISQGLADLFSADPQVLSILHEYWSAAARDEAHAARYRHRHGALRDALAGALAARHDQTGVPLAVPADELAEVFIALAVGLGMSALVDPGSVRQGLFGDIASLIYDGMVLVAARHEGDADG